MGEKRHILLIENNENEIEFFIDALEESELDFFLITVRNIHHVFIILNSGTADMVFINVHLAINHNMIVGKKLKSVYQGPVVFYSNVKDCQMECGCPNYVQLPGNTQSMGRILRNLLADTKIEHEPEVLAEN